MNEISSFETSRGSVYVYDSSGRVTRQQSATHGSSLKGVRSSFDKTVFVAPEDISSVKLGYQRGLKPLEDGTLQGLDFNADKLNTAKLIELQNQGMSFDEAYTSSGGRITRRNITPELQPRIGYNPFEYNLGNNKYHAGNPVVKINKAAEPATKRIGPTPPESGTTLKNVGREPAQTRLRGKAIEKVYPTPNLGHEATIADIENIKKQRQKADEAAQRAEQKAQERAQKKVTRRTERKTKAEVARAATETAEQASKNPGGIPVRRTGRR